MQEHMHHKRRLLIALVAAGGMSVGLGSLAATANAVPRTFLVTVVGNIKKTITDFPDHLIGGQIHAQIQATFEAGFFITDWFSIRGVVRRI